MCFNRKKCIKCFLVLDLCEFKRNNKETYRYRICNTCVVTPMIKCNHCNGNKLPIEFEKNGKILKTCNNCRQNNKNCPHDK
jgi:hypothetical protein